MYCMYVCMFVCMYIFVCLYVFMYVYMFVYTYIFVRMYVSYGDTLPHTVVGVCGEFQRTGRFLQRGI